MLVFAAGAFKIWIVVAPLSTTRVSGSHTWLRIPICARSRPASSSMLLSAALRGAGPPNRASIAWLWASPTERPAVPATGGVRLKSGGMISGALRATANSSGVLFRPLRKMEQPLVATAATITTAVRTLRMFDSLPGFFTLCALLTSEERSQQQDHDADANRCVADIEYQKRPEVAEMQVSEVDDIAEADPVEDVSKRPAKHHPERELVEAVLFLADPVSDPDRDDRSQRDQHPAADRIGRIQEAERDSVVFGVGQVEDRQEHDLPDFAQLQRAGDDPFRQLVES